MTTMDRRHARRAALALASIVVTCGVALGPGGPPAAGAEGELVMDRHVIGVSVNGRDIVAFHRHYPQAWRRVVVIGSIHGDEQAGMRVITQLKRRLPPKNVDLWLIPTVNLDGVAADRRTNAHRVDLNRNFPYRWREVNIGKETYSGPSAASEPETRVLRAFINDVDPRITITFHQPLFGVGLNTKRNGVVRALAAGMGLPVKSFACSGVCYGSFTSWHNARKDGVAVTVEFGEAPVPDWRIRKAAVTVLSVGSSY